MPHYDVLPAELALVAPIVALALLGTIVRTLRLLSWRLNPCSSNGVVANAEGVLLPHQWNRLPHPGASHSIDSTADTASNPATNTPTNAAAAAPDSTAPACRSS